MIIREDIVHDGSTLDLTNAVGLQSYLFQQSVCAFITEELIKLIK